jgi:hypothetical protein
MASAPNQLRARLRRQLEGGKSEKGHELSDDKKFELWGQFLDLHVASARPGRAIAVRDVEHMIQFHVVRLSSGYNGESAPSAPRSLSPAELRAIGEWLAKHRADTPSGAADIRATEVFLCPASTVGRGGPPFSCWFPPKRRESLGPSCAPGNPIQPPELDSRLVSWHSLFRDTPDRRSDHCIRPT